MTIQNWPNIILIVFIMHVWVTCLHAQNVDSVKAESQLQKAEELKANYNTKEALLAVDSAIDMFRSIGEVRSIGLLRSYQLKVATLLQLHHYPQAAPLVDTAFELAQLILPKDDYRFGLVYKNRAIMNIEQDKYIQAKRDLQKSVFYISKDSSTQRELGPSITMEMGILSRKMGNSHDAINYYLLGLDMMETIADTIQIAKSHHNLANAYYDIGENGLSRFHYKQALKLYPDKYLFGKALAHEGIALTYRDEHVFDLAVTNLQLGIEYVIEAYGEDHYYTFRLKRKKGAMLERLGKYKEAIQAVEDDNFLDQGSRAYQVAASCYLKLNEPETAKKYIFNVLGGKDAYTNDSIYMLPTLVNYYRTVGDLDKAEEACWVNLEKRKSYFNPTDVRIQQVYIQLAEIKEEKKNYDEVHACLDSLLLSRNMSVKLPNDNFIRSELWEEIMQLKCRALYNEYKASGNKKLPDQVLTIASQYLSALDTIRQNASSIGSQLDLSGRPATIINMVLDLLFESYEKSQQDSIVGKALLDMDLVRDMLWIDLVQYKEATDVTPSQLKRINIENNIRKKIASLELQQQFNPDSIQIKQELTALSENLQELTGSENYYLNKSFNPAEVIERLKNSKTVSLIYYEGEGWLFRILIANGKAEFTRIPWNTDHEKWVFSISEKLSQKGREVFVDLDSLSQIVLQGVQVPNHKLIQIYPDGNLHLIPFELLTLPEEDDIILINHSISYNSSIKRTFFDFPTVDYSRDLAAFAPSYKEWTIDLTDTLGSEALASIVRSDIVDLPAAPLEVASIQNYFKGVTFIEEDATVDNFYSYCQDSRILHLSMHALVEMKQPNLSRLVFSGGENLSAMSRYCFAGELASQNIPAELVVLSACNTGLGEYKRGEGVRSLARSFEYAGARSTVHSLWKIPDAATKELMDAFYSHLHQGLPRAEALRTAKIDFKNQNENSALAHPYFWAGFVLNGDSGVIYEKVTWPAYYWIAGVIIIFGILFLFGKWIISKRTRLNEQTV